MNQELGEPTSHIHSVTSSVTTSTTNIRSSNLFQEMAIQNVRYIFSESEPLSLAGGGEAHRKRSNEVKRPMQSKDIRCRNERIIKWGRVGLIVLYLVSLLLPSMYATIYLKAGWRPGFLCLILVPFVMALPPWWANPVFFVGLFSFFVGKFEFACQCGIVATLLSLSTPIFFRDNSLGPGYYTWLSCMVGLAALAWFAHVDRLNFPQRHFEDQTGP